MDYRNDLEVDIFLHGEDKALENITIGMVKQDNIECCVCYNFHWGVKLPNCNHFICPKCYYKLYNGYISENFYIRNIEPEFPENPIYPYKKSDKNRELFNSISKDDIFLEWFIDENEDLYNSIKMNSEFVDNIDIKLKIWFQTNELLKKYENDVINYNNKLKQYYIDNEKYNDLYEEEKEYNKHAICPLCRS